MTSRLVVYARPGRHPDGGKGRECVRSRARAVRRAYGPRSSSGRIAVRKETSPPRARSPIARKTCRKGSSRHSRPSRASWRTSSRDRGLRIPEAEREFRRRCDFIRIASTPGSRSPPSTASADRRKDARRIAVELVGPAADAGGVPDVHRQCSTAPRIPRESPSSSRKRAADSRRQRASPSPAI